MSSEYVEIDESQSQVLITHTTYGTAPRDRSTNFNDTSRHLNKPMRYFIQFILSAVVLFVVFGWIVFGSRSLGAYLDRGQFQNPCTNVSVITHMYVFDDATSRHVVIFAEMIDQFVYDKSHEFAYHDDGLLFERYNGTERLDDYQVGSSVSMKDYHLILEVKCLNTYNKEYGALSDALHKNLVLFGEFTLMFILTMAGSWILGACLTRHGVNI